MNDVNGWGPPRRSPQRTMNAVDRWYKVVIEILTRLLIFGLLGVFVGYVWWGVIALVAAIASR